MKTQSKPQNLVLKGGCHIMRIDMYYDIRNEPTCRINCIDDETHTQDLDGEWVEEYTEGRFFLKEKDIDMVISKLQEAKEFLKSRYEMQS